MFFSKTIIVTVVLNLVGILSAYAAESNLKYLENRIGVAHQSFGINGYYKSAICRVAVSDSAIIVGSRFNITPENERDEAIVSQVFLFDDKLTLKQFDETTLKAERRFKTPEKYCTNPQTGAFYPLRSVETVQTLNIEGNKVEITEVYRCGLLFPTHKMVNKTICELAE